MPARAATTLMTPIGELVLVAGGEALREIRLPDPAVGLHGLGQPAFGFVSTPPSTDAVLDEAQRQLREYFAGTRREFDLPLDGRGTTFQRRVWDALREVGYGQTVTYGDLARAIGRPAAARAVGGALAVNPLPLVVPCHRVIGIGGDLRGFGGGIARKRYLIESEAARAGA